MKADIAKVSDAVGQLIAALTVLLSAGNTAEFTRNTEREDYKLSRVCFDGTFGF